MNELKPCPFEAKAEAIAAWNRRAQPAAPADAAPSVAPEPLGWYYMTMGTDGQLIGHVRDRRPRGEHILDLTPLVAASPARAPLTEEQRRDLVKECGLDWQRGYMPLFEGDPTNRYAVLVEAVEAAHGIGGK